MRAPSLPVTDQELSLVLVLAVAACKNGNVLAIARARKPAIVFDKIVSECLRILVVADKDRLVEAVKNIDDRVRELLVEWLGECRNERDPVGKDVCAAMQLADLTSILDALGVPYVTLVQDCNDEPPVNERLDLRSLLS